jgi:hypothetical protein
VKTKERPILKNPRMGHPQTILCITSGLRGQRRGRSEIQSQRPHRLKVARMRYPRLRFGGSANHTSQLTGLIRRWKRADKVGDDFVEVVGVVDEHGVASFEEFDAGGGEFGLDEFGLGLEIRFINVQGRLVQFGEDGGDIAEAEDIEHFYRGSVGRGFQ